MNMIICVCKLLNTIQTVLYPLLFLLLGVCPITTNTFKSKSELDKTEDIKYYVTQLKGNKDNSSAEVYEDTQLYMCERSNNDTGCYSRKLSN